MDAARTEPKKCSKKRCKKIIPPPGPGEKDFATCKDCLASSVKAKAKQKRKQAEADKDHSQVSPVSNGDAEGPSAGPSTVNEPIGQTLRDTTPEVRTLTINIINHCYPFKMESVIVYTNSQSLFSALREAFKEGKHVEFFGTYCLPEDALVND